MNESNKDMTRSERLSESAGVATTLAAEHEQLLSEVSDRAGVVLGETVEGRWPSLALRELVDYLHLEVLQQVVDEEWLLFGSAYHAPEELARLRQDHLELRLAIDVLAQAAAGGGDRSPRRLAAATQDLLARLEEHLAAEERVLSAASSDSPSTAGLGAQPHEWYAITEQSLIDLDRLPGRRGFDAVLDRLLRMRPADEVELSGSTDPGPIWQRLARANPGSYGSETLENGPTRWRLNITCRSGYAWRRGAMSIGQNERGNWRRMSAAKTCGHNGVSLVRRCQGRAG
jgi:uncharacterized protein (DUF2249 family)